jgi:hypothetical protein
MPAPRVGQEPVCWLKAGIVVLLPAQCRRVLRRPGGAGSPGVDSDDGIAVDKVNGRRTVRRVARAPCLTITEAKALAGPERRQGQTEVERSGGAKLRPDVGSSISRDAVGSPA